MDGSGNAHACQSTATAPLATQKAQIGVPKLQTISSLRLNGRVSSRDQPCENGAKASPPSLRASPVLCAATVPIDGGGGLCVSSMGTTRPLCKWPESEFNASGAEMVCPGPKRTICPDIHS